MKRIYGDHWPWLFGLYLSLAIICGYQSWSKVVVDSNGVVWNNQSSVDTLVSILSDHPIGTAVWPQIRSRILLPLLIVKANAYFGIPYRVMHDGLRLLFIFLSLILIHWHFRAWFAPLESLAGTVIVIASVIITFNGTYPTVTEFPELVGMTVCTALLVRRRWWWMLLALGVATLNRETSVVFGAVVFCFLYRGRKSISIALALTSAVAVTWWLAYSGARLLAGVGGEWVQISQGTMSGQGVVRELVGVFVDLWPRRVESILSLVHNPHPYNVNWSVFLVMNVFWIAPLFSWRSIPPSLKRLYIGGILGGSVIFALAGVLNEAGRHMIPLYPLVMPAGLYAFYRRVTPDAPPVLQDQA